MHVFSVEVTAVLAESVGVGTPWEGGTEQNERTKRHRAHVWNERQGCQQSDRMLQYSPYGVKDVILWTMTYRRRFGRLRQIQGQLISVGLKGKFRQKLIQGHPGQSSSDP